jgi:hypothetical protein
MRVAAFDLPADAGSRCLDISERKRCREDGALQPWPVYRHHAINAGE